MRMRCKDFFCWDGGSLLLLGITSSDPPPPPPPPFFKKKKGSKFQLPASEGESEKFKRAGSIVHGDGLLKRVWGERSSTFPI